MELISIEIGIFPKANCIILIVVKNARCRLTWWKMLMTKPINVHFKACKSISVIISVIIHKESH